MPESHSRKRSQFVPPASKGSSARSHRANRWVAPLMVACWVLGLLWIVTFYIVGDRIGFFSELGNWNLLVGMGLVALGFVFATRWE